MLHSAGRLIAYQDDAGCGMTWAGKTEAPPLTMEVSYGFLKQRYPILIGFSFINLSSNHLGPIWYLQWPPRNVIVRCGAVDRLLAIITRGRPMFLAISINVDYEKEWILNYI